MIPESPNLAAHLSEDALDDLLLGIAGPSAEAHLAACPECAARIVAFRSSMAVFNRASTAWSQARSNTIPRDFAPSSRRAPFLPVWSFVAAVLFAVAVSFLFGIHRGMEPRQTAREATPSAVAEPAVDRQQEIAGDNDLLHAIDSAIYQPVASPDEVYGITGPTPAARRADVTREVRD